MLNRLTVSFLSKFVRSRLGIPVVKCKDKDLGFLFTFFRLLRADKKGIYSGRKRLEVSATVKNFGALIACSLLVIWIQA